MTNNTHGRLRKIQKLRDKDFGLKLYQIALSHPLVVNFIFYGLTLTIPWNIFCWKIIVEADRQSKNNNIRPFLSYQSESEFKMVQSGTELTRSVSDR